MPLPALPLLLVLLAAPPALAAEPPTNDAPEADVLAAAVRVRGFACDQPQPPVADAKQAQPDRPAWIVRCAQGRYRVTYEGDTGPQVTPLD